MGKRWAVSSSVPLRGPIRALALAPTQTRGAYFGASSVVAPIHAHGGHFLAHRTRISSDVSSQLAAFHVGRGNRRLMDGLLPLQPEIAAPAGAQCPADT